MLTLIKWEMSRFLKRSWNMSRIVEECYENREVSRIFKDRKADGVAPVLTSSDLLGEMVRYDKNREVSCIFIIKLE